MPLGIPDKPSDDMKFPLPELWREKLELGIETTHTNCSVPALWKQATNVFSYLRSSRLMVKHEFPQNA